MTSYEDVKESLKAQPKTWLVTGVAGFIGSNLLETLLTLNQKVVGLDNFATGHRHNLADVQKTVGAAWQNFVFSEGDLTKLDECHKAVAGVDVILHQGALGSVPRSIADPIASNNANVNGFLNMLVAAKENGVKRFVYAASSSTYGDEKNLPKIEHRIGMPLSPYAVTKYVNELYAHVFALHYGIEPIGLRYFNVFGRRQDPDGAYAAVIPKWIGLLLQGKPCTINGNPDISRDFCYIENVIQANILAATSMDPAALNQVYNVAYGERTTLAQLYGYLRDGLNTLGVQGMATLEPVIGNLRSGDVTHSLADVTKAKTLLGYAPTYSVNDGLQEALAWYYQKQTTLTAS